MECKNCNLALRTDYCYCSNCGAKVIRNRITLKNLWYDFTERFFNLDNTFLLTFKHLFTKPDIVIVAYINGVRKKYVNPVSYFTIAVFLGGLLYFLIQKFFLDAMNYQFEQMTVDSSDPSQKFGIEFGKQFQNLSMEYQSLFYIAMLPFLSLISRLVFYNKKQFNLSEHFVINIYAYSHISLAVNIMYILSVWNSQLFYYISLINSLTLLIYFSYVYKKVFKLNWKQLILKLMLFAMIFGIVFIILIIIATVYFVAFTDTFKHLKEAQAMLLN